MNSVFDGYEPLQGRDPPACRAPLVVFESGETSGYGLYNAQDRGILFVGPGLPVYEGMIVGMSPKTRISPSMSARKTRHQHAGGRVGRGASPHPADCLFP